MKRTGLSRMVAAVGVAVLALSVSTATPADAARRVVTVSSQAGFTTPDGSVTCQFWDGSVRCDVADRRFASPRRPASCDLDWGDSLYLSRKAGFGCIGDSIFGAADLGSDSTRWYSPRNGIKVRPVSSGNPKRAGLRPGVALRTRGIECTTTAKNAITCTNLKTKRGFTVSRSAYRLK